MMFQKRNVHKVLSLLSLFIVTVSLSYGQEKEICGKVTTFNEFTLNGVLVTARKSDQMAKTDTLGNYCIKCENRDKLTFQAKGFYKKRVRIRNQDSVNVDMKFKGGEKNKKIASGLGYIDKEDLSYAVSTISDEGKDYSQYSDIFDLIDNEVPNVKVYGDKVYIRSEDSPLFVVDGSYRDDISHIHPMDVKSISVIKDSGTSVYGSRGANGVIVIETKTQ